jgi:hypothetical protein
LEDQQGTPIPPIPNPVEPLLPRIGKLNITWPWQWRKPGAAQIVDSEPVENTDDFRRQRRLIESFSEDYLSWPDKAKLALVKIVAFALPVVAILAVGTDVGAFFAPALGAFSSYLLAYAIESGIAASTIMLGMALSRPGEGKAFWWKVATLAAVWLIASLASGAVMFLISLQALPAGAHLTGLAGAVIALRTAAVMLLDLMSVAILFFRGKSLQRHLSDLALKSHAILAVNESELTIQRAQEQAEMRRKEDEQYLEGKRRAAEVVNELQELTNQALLDVARRNLLRGPEEGTNRRMGRY